ncbi:hypothetical protein, partial [Escherichia coli]|uniref:hypothetical protein n=1 Tax=Escherichia coli TaxID=562 RepID=UPI0028A246EF
WSFRGSKSRNKVSVGEPAEGSLKSCKTPKPYVYLPVSLLRQAVPPEPSPYGCLPEYLKLLLITVLSE